MGRNAQANEWGDVRVKSASPATRAFRFSASVTHRRAGAQPQASLAPIGECPLPVTFRGASTRLNCHKLFAF